MRDGRIRQLQQLHDCTVRLGLRESRESREWPWQRCIAHSSLALGALCSDTGPTLFFWPLPPGQRWEGGRGGRGGCTQVQGRRLDNTRKRCISDSDLDFTRTCQGTREKHHHHLSSVAPGYGPLRATDVARDEQLLCGSARRRRLRRLRSWRRHERLSVAAALAEAFHHTWCVVCFVLSPTGTGHRQGEVCGQVLFWVVEVCCPVQIGG